MQDELTRATPPSNPARSTKPQLQDLPIRNGITIFPGGVPLYKNGVLVGAIGVSGDGVDQDDNITFAGTKNFRPAPRSAPTTCHTARLPTSS